MSFATLLLVIAGMLMIGISGLIIAHPTLKSASSPAIAVASANPKDVITRNYDIRYPVFGVEKVDTALKAFAVKKTDEFIAKLGDKKYDRNNRLVLRYAVVHHGARTATVVFYQQEIRSDQPVVLSQSMMTYDLQTQSELKIGDILKGDPNTFFGLLFYDYFKQYPPEGFTQTQFFNLLGFTTDAIQGFWLGDDTLTVQFNSHQLSDRTSFKTIQIKKRVVSDVLKPEYQADDKGSNMSLSDPEYTIDVRPKPADEIDPTQKMLALTFDDGPGGHTNRVLDALAKYRAHGTFFVIGRQVPGHADILQRMVNGGNEVGNHSWDHAQLPGLSTGRLDQEIGDTQRAISDATGGYVPTQMRPPYGALDSGVAGYIHGHGLKVALWNVDTEDWLHRDAGLMYNSIMGSAADGRVILLHDIHPTSVEAVERAIPDLVAQGYQLVTMSQLERYR